MTMDRICSLSPLPGKALFSGPSSVYGVRPTVQIISPWDVPRHKNRREYPLHISPKEGLWFWFS